MSKNVLLSVQVDRDFRVAIRRLALDRGVTLQALVTESLLPLINPLSGNDLIEQTEPVQTPEAETIESIPANILPAQGKTPADPADEKYSGDNPIMPLVTQAEFARLLGVAKPYVNKLVTQGILTLNDDGKLDYDGSLAILKARASPGHQLSRASADDTPAMREIRSAAGEEPNHDAPPAPESAGVGGFQAARTQREHYAALNERVKYEREIGRQVDRAGVERACKAAARLIRDNVLAVPDQITATLAAETDPKKVHALLFKALRDALNRTLHGLETPIKPLAVDDEPTAH